MSERRQKYLVYDVANIGALEVDPAHNSRNELVLGGDRQEIVRLRQFATSLHDDGTAHGALSELGFQVRRAERAAQSRNVVTHPGIVAPGDVPKVLMRVDTQGASRIWASSIRELLWPSASSLRLMVWPLGIRSIS